MRHGVHRNSRLNLCFSCLLLFAFALLPAQSSFAQESAKPSFSDSLALSTDSVEPHRFVAAHGRRSVIMGYAETGLEIWAYPYQILSGYHIGFRPLGTTTETDGRLLLRRITYEPDSITRIYIGSDYIVHEKLFVPLDQPGAILSYEVENRKPVDIEIHFTPVLNLMWPAAIGGQYTQWNSELSGFVISEPLNSASAVIASHEIVTHDETVNTTVRAGSSYSFSVRPNKDVNGKSTATVYVAFDFGDAAKVATALHELSAHRADAEAQATAHYAELERNALRILTPDHDVNRALAWAEVALDQAWVCNPKIGCGMVAGYGPSRDARRPQYDWFFAGDGLVATNAFLASGEYSRAREELEFIAKYQDQKTGMIWHELSQSAGYFDWSKYPYMFVHVDISFDYLNTIARYVSVSGDTAFATSHWSSITAAYNYCRSLIRPSDNLPHIPAEKEGGDEQSRPDDDIGLSSAWVAATASFAELAQVTGNTQLVDEALKANQLAEKSIGSRYWDSARHFWIEGHTRSGEPIFSWMRGPVRLIAQNVFSPQQNDELLNQLASSDFQTDWGMRGVSASSTVFDPDSYSRGSVSSLGTAEAAIGFWQVHRSAIAFGLWSGILPWNTLDSLGHLHEVLAGNLYHEEEESVPEQTWSSAGFLDSAVHGLLGLDVQGAQNHVVFAPHLPAQWDQTSVENIRLTHSTLTFKISQSINTVDLDIKNDGKPVSISFEPQIPLGADQIKADCEDHPVTASRELFPADEHAKMEIDAPSGASHCHIHFTGGVSVTAKQPTPQLGDSSTGIKITSIHLEDRTLSLDADVNSAGDNVLLIQTPWKITTLKGATAHPRSNFYYEITLPRPSAPTKPFGYAPSHAEITFAEK